MGGKNGYGENLTNIFLKQFTETTDRNLKKSFKMTFDNMTDVKNRKLRHVEQNHLQELVIFRIIHGQWTK